MELLCIGLSHRTAPLAVRERLALPEARQVELLQRLAAGAQRGAAWCPPATGWSCTCAAPDADRARESACATSCGRWAGPRRWSTSTSTAARTRCVHLFRVAASLDSMVLGEAQILGQVKDAFERGQGAGAVRGELTRACAAAFGCAKRVRTETAIGRAATSMASRGGRSWRARCSTGWRGKTVLLVGAGEMARAGRASPQAGGRHAAAGRPTAPWRAPRRSRPRWAARRGPSRSCSRCSPRRTWWCAARPRRCPSSPEGERGRGGARRAGTGRCSWWTWPCRATSTPRWASWTGCTPTTWTTSRSSSRRTPPPRAEEAQKAGRAGGPGGGPLRAGARPCATGVPVLAQLRQRAEAIARAEVERTLARPRATASPTSSARASRRWARAIVNKLLHEPTARLRAVGPEDEGNRLAGAAAELFGLERARAAAPSRGRRAPRRGQRRQAMKAVAHRHPAEPAGALAGPPRGRAARRQHHPGLEVSLVEMTTEGDRFLSAPLSAVGGKGLFVKEIEQALLDGRADLAVHSLKDMTSVLPAGLLLAARAARARTRATPSVGPAGLTLDMLPQGARVGTSSLRRSCILRARRPDLEIVSLRGNVQTRLARMRELGLARRGAGARGPQAAGPGERITEVLPEVSSLPAVGQGVLAIQCPRRAPRGARAARPAGGSGHPRGGAGRARLHAARLGGGLHRSAGGTRDAGGSTLRLRGLIGRPDGTKVIGASAAALLRPDAADGHRAGRRAAENGGREHAGVSSAEAAPPMPADGSDARLGKLAPPLEQAGLTRTPSEKPTLGA